MGYILDADIRSFFDEVSQEWLAKFLNHRIGDPRIIRLIQKWLRAGYLEDDVVTISDKGTGQGSVASPLLANVYLHYVFDLWADNAGRFRLGAPPRMKPGTRSGCSTTTTSSRTPPRATTAPISQSPARMRSPGI